LRDTISVARLLEIDEQDQASRRAETIRDLKQRVQAAAVARTGVVRVSVRTPSPGISQQIADLIIREVNRFNLQTRQSQAASERRFTEQRLAEVRIALRGAEDRLQHFLQSNRAMSGSAQLQFTLDRLKREVSQQQDMYASLSQSFEQAKIEEVRDTPVITIVESPEIPTRPDPRGLATRGVLAGLVGLMIGILLAFVRDVSRSSGARSDSSLAELARLREEAVADIRHPVRAAKRALGRETAVH
jgi:uncharacterized protein involved in exopolysaccharide biosynthesis